LCFFGLFLLGKSAFIFRYITDESLELKFTFKLRNSLSTVQIRVSVRRKSGSSEYAHLIPLRVKQLS
jgi:hypothetical protein